MKNRRAKWAVILVLAVISSSVWATIWNPDLDADLAFNLNFENNTDTTTTDAKAGLTGTFDDYSVTHDFWEENGRINTSADFGEDNDSDTGVENDCTLYMPADSIFDWGEPEDKFTYTLWFNSDDLDSVTFIRRGPLYPEDPDYSDWWWEIRIDESKLRCYHQRNYLRMETTQVLSDLGVTENTWHFAAIVVDRTVKENSKLYVDGLEVPVTYTAYKDYGDASVDTKDYDLCDLEIGSGEFEFEGLLDEIRIYQRVLTNLEVSILYQTDGEVKPIALLPIPRSHNVSVGTDLTWEPAAGATAQEVFFGPNSLSMSSVKSGSGTMNIVDNSLLGSLQLDTTYYWTVDSTVGGSPLEGPLWSFTTETGLPFNPSPADGQKDVPVGPVTLSWTPSSSASSFDVYLSDDKSLVEANSVSVRVEHNIGTPSALVFDGSDPIKGETYYWRVISNFPPATSIGTSTGEVWSFRIEPKLIIVNTSDVAADYNEISYPALTFTDTETATVTTGTLGDDDTAVFKFLSGLNINEYYDIVVIPLFDDELEAQMETGGHRRTSRPMALQVTGNASINCTIDVSGIEAPATESGPSSQGRCGGHRGSYRNEDRASMTDDDMLEIFGPGYGETSVDYSCGAGAGYGGKGGDQYRAGGGSGGPAYGYQQVLVPLGGSAGGWGNRAAGAPGGGAVEISATGNIVFGSDAQLIVDGGSGPSQPVDYAPGGGSGGSVRIIAGGIVTNQGTISANGGIGGDTNKKDYNAGGGGAGGRVSIYYDTSYTNNGQITVTGGREGYYMGNEARSDSGEDGTMFVSDANPAKPDFPTPADESEAAVEAGQIELKWYPGFGATKNEVYLGSDPCSLSLVSTINAVPEHCGTLRAQQNHVQNVNTGQTYYWYVKTTYSGGTVGSNLWSFSTVEDFKIVFNTDDTYTMTYEGTTIAPLTCKVRDAGGWSSPVATGSIASDGVAIFNFDDFDYDLSYNIVVLPECGPAQDANVTPTPLAIHVNGDFYFDGNIDISGDDAFMKENQPKGRSGGHRGPRHGDGGTPIEYADGYYTSADDYPTGTRFGPYPSSNKPYYIPTSTAYGIFGPGTPITATYKMGGGAGYGGIGGDCGRGYQSGIFSGGGDYGDEEVPVPFGGSAGSWGKFAPGGAGGGGVEIVATGNVTLGSHADVYAEGGSILFAAQYSGSGGSGGSVRIIAGGSFSSAGIISVNGGQGGNTSDQLYNTTGGGAGGRVAIFYGTAYNNIGQITADGGAKGLYAGGSYGEDGEDGTIYTSGGSPKKASAPTPRDGDEMVCASSGSIQLKWYAGYGAGSDKVYFGTNPGSLTQVGSAVTSPARGQRSSTINASIVAGQTYYWKVVSDSAVESDVWSFSTVDWECLLVNKPEWDAFYYYDCVVDLEDLAYFVQYWLDREPVDFGAFSWFAGEWLDDSGRTNCP